MPRPYPNVSKSQWATVREKVDSRFLDLVRLLEDSYYGTALTWDAEGGALTRVADGWKHGLSHPFVSGPHVYDFSTTPEGSRVLFDELHGLIWQHHMIASVDQNDIDNNPYPDMDVLIADVEIARVPEQAANEERFIKTTVSRKAEAQTKVDEFKAGGIEIEAP